MVQHVVGVASGIHQHVGEDRQAVEGAVLVDAFRESNDGGRESRGFDGDGAGVTHRPPQRSACHGKRDEANSPNPLELVERGRLKPAFPGVPPMAATKDIFAPLMDEAKRIGLPIGMLQEVFDSNDTAVMYGDSVKYPGEVITVPVKHTEIKLGYVARDNYIQLPSKYLTGDSSALRDLRSVQKSIMTYEKGYVEYAPVPEWTKQSCGPRKGAFRWRANPELNPADTFMPICVGPGALYNEMFHAWYDQVLEGRDSRIYDYLIDQAKARYSGNLLAIEECWSDTADKYIVTAYDNYRNKFPYEWSFQAGHLTRCENKSFGTRTPLTHEFTKFRVSHEETFPEALADVEISAEEWTLLVKVLHKGMKAETDFPVSQRREKEKKEKEERYAVRRK